MVSHIHYRKYDGSEHWRIEVQLLREDDRGWWLRGRAGGRATRPGHEVIEKVGFVALVPRGAWWVAFWNFDRDGDYELYVDVATPAVAVGGELELVDLDLDVVRGWDHTVQVLDEDEFAEHTVRFGYPDDVVRSARAAADELVEAITRGDPPFDLFDASGSQF